MIERDLEVYEREFRTLHFEEIQSELRRSSTRQFVENRPPGVILDVGCGPVPFISDDVISRGQTYFALEPISSFYFQAKESVKSGHFFNMTLADFSRSNHFKAFDLINIDCVLHEVSDPVGFLRDAKECLSSSGGIRISVPNANSLHRLVGVAMGVLESPERPTKTQRRMQQNSDAYTLSTLCDLLAEVGLVVITHGAFMLKPYTHFQMQTMLDLGLIDRQIVDELNHFGEMSPSIASELWVYAGESHE